MNTELIEVNPNVIAFYVEKTTGKGLEEGLRAIGIRSKEIERIKKGWISPDGLVELSEALNIAMIRLMDLNEERLKVFMMGDFRRKKAAEENDVENKLLDVLMDTNDLVFLLKQEEVIGDLSIPRSGVSEKPETASKRMRKALGLSLKVQTEEIKDFDDMIEWLRDKLWEKGVIVIVKDLPESIDGVSYVYNNTGIILSRKDAYPQRTIFTIVHELGHLLIGKYVFEDNLMDVPEEKKSEWEIERWCNKFAAHFLLPEDANEELIGVVEIRDEKERKKNLKKLMKKYKVSMSVLLYRAKELGVKEIEEGEIEQRKGHGRKDYVRATIKSYGRKTVETVVELYKEGKVDELRIMNILNIGGKTLTKLTEVVEK